MEKLARFGRSRTGKRRGSNAARDLHRWIHRDKRLLPVEVSTTRVPIRLRKRTKTHGAKKVEHCWVDHPVVLFSSWLVTIMNLFPRYFLGGYGPGEIDKYRRMFESFWSNYRNVDGQHEVYQKPSCDLGHCIPLALHGDEGRGLAKTPLMVLSIQTIIPSTGENDLSQAQQLGH